MKNKERSLAVSCDRPFEAFIDQVRSDPCSLLETVSSHSVAMRCLQCQRVFSDRATLREHMLESHSSQLIASMRELAAARRDEERIAAIAVQVLRDGPRAWIEEYTSDLYRRQLRHCV